MSSRKTSRRRRRVFWCIVAAGLASGLLVGPSVVHSPGEVRDPVSAYLVFARLHTGVIVPAEDGGWVEYSFGEWDWYAHDRDAWYRAIPALLWRTDGALGRRDFRLRDPEAIRRHVQATRLVSLRLERSRVQSFRRRMDAIFDGEELHRNEARRMSFVAWKSYWFWDHCHDATARWLEELGCEVSRRVVRTGLRIAD